MTKDEIENDVRLLVEELKADRDPLNMAVSTLTRLGDDPDQFMTWMTALVEAAPGEQFTAFKARIASEAIFKAKNRLYHERIRPQAPSVTNKPQIETWNILRVSAWHLMPETRMDMISTGVLKQACVFLDHVVGPRGGWLLDMTSINSINHTEQRKRSYAAPDVGPILRLADSLSCTHVLFSISHEMTQGLKTWHP